MITLGIDVGSITAKAALVKDGKLLSTAVIVTGYNSKNAGDTVFEKILSEAGVNRSEIEGIVATGYGRNSVSFAGKSIT